MPRPVDKNFSTVCLHLGLEIVTDNLKQKPLNFNDPRNHVEITCIGTREKYRRVQAEMQAGGQAFQVLLNFWLSIFGFYLA